MPCNTHKVKCFETTLTMLLYAEELNLLPAARTLWYELDKHTHGHLYKWATYAIFFILQGDSIVCLKRKKKKEKRQFWIHLLTTVERSCCLEVERNNPDPRETYESIWYRGSAKEKQCSIPQGLDRWYFKSSYCRGRYRC